MGAILFVQLSYWMPFVCACNEWLGCLEGGFVNALVDGKKIAGT